MHSFTATRFLFLDNDQTLQGSAQVLGLVDYHAGGLPSDQPPSQALVLDQTYFYPQGGGQPADQGVIRKDGAEIQVTDVRKENGVVYHIGQVVRGAFTAGDQVRMEVNAEARLLNSRLHSAGHLLDVALERIGYLMEPTKGYHFPNGPYVEYVGDIPAENRDTVRAQAEAEANKLIAAGGLVNIQTVPLDHVKNVSHFVPDYLSADQPVRVVTVSGAWGCPCGGTHIKDIREIKHIAVGKIKSKDGKLRVSYDVVRA